MQALATPLRSSSQVGAVPKQEAGLLKAPPQGSSPALLLRTVETCAACTGPNAHPAPRMPCFAHMCPGHAPCHSLQSGIALFCFASTFPGFALRDGLLRVVQLSLLGSVVSNLLVGGGRMGVG